MTICAGDSDRAAAEITAQADAAGLQGSQLNGTAACVRYLDGKREFLRYSQPLNAGWTTATGIIKAACRHLIADPLSIGGARRGLNGAEAIISNGNFEEHRRFHLQRERRRRYPGINQGQYTLGA